MALPPKPQPKPRCFHMYARRVVTRQGVQMIWCSLPNGHNEFHMNWYVDPQGVIIYQYWNDSGYYPGAKS